MGFTSRSLSALGQLAMLAVVLVAFLFGMAGAVYMSLSGSEIKVPDIVGKDFVESEKELSSLGLKIKKRADRPSGEKINTVLEQLPKPGETVKTGQMILVVVSKAGDEADVPASLKKDIETDDTEKIEEMISDKPRRPRSNSNINRKKADTSRDTSANESNANTAVNNNSREPAEDDGKRVSPSETNPADRNKNGSPGPGTRPQATPADIVRPPASRTVPDTRPKPPVRPEQ